MTGRALLAVVCLVGFGCAERALVRDGVRMPEREVVERDLRSASEAMEANKPEQAREILERTRAEAPLSRRGDEVLLALGEIYRRQGDRERAILTWRELVLSHPKSARQTEARLRLARVGLELPPIDESRRLAGDASGARSRGDALAASTTDDALPAE